MVYILLAYTRLFHDAPFLPLRIDAHFTDVVANVASGDGSDVVLIAVSLSYEFPPPAKGSKDLCGWKPDVRINFGLPHSFLVRYSLLLIAFYT